MEIDYNGSILTLSKPQNSTSISLNPNNEKESGGLRKLVGKLDRDMDDLLKEVKELGKLINSKKNCL